MKPHSALAAAVACGAAAVLLVGLDLAFNVGVRLDARASDGSWSLVESSAGGASDSPARPVPCGNQFRVTVHNGLPWSVTRTVTVQPGGPGEAATSQDWTLAPWQSRTWEFHLNGTSSAPTSPTGAPPKGADSVSVQVGTTIFLYAQVCPEGRA